LPGYRFGSGFTSEEVAKWIKAECGLEPVPPFTACGIVNSEGQLCGAWVWSEYTGHNVELSVYAPGCLTRHILKEGFSYAFNQIGVSRITQRIPMSNKRIGSILMRCGFVFEGILRRFYGADEDAAIYGLIKEECRFLNAQR
jgi:hypothetical protein